jgi:RimJ/RimL family protein N-acetyltransferase
MQFSNQYKVLNKSRFCIDKYSLVPIRFEDRYDIMKWRNEQIYHLRQSEPLTKEVQDDYFNNVVSKLFVQDKPNQLLFSYLYKNECIGYGGMVHINWIDKNAEISFVMNTELEKDEFHKHWSIYLDLLHKVAFNELNFHKIYTYAFDLRPHLYSVLESAGFYKEAILKEHCRFEGKFIDVIIHSKINNLSPYLRKATYSDCKLLFEWTNDSAVRNNSFNSASIPFEDHQHWFNNVLNDSNKFLFILCDGTENIGQIRLDKQEDGNAIVNYSISKLYRGKGYGLIIIQLINNYIIDNSLPIISLIAKVKKENVASQLIFKKCGYQISDKEDFFEYKFNLR